MTKIPQSENQYIEFKSERVSAKNLAEEIVAFANAAIHRNYSIVPAGKK